MNRFTFEYENSEYGLPIIVAIRLANFDAALSIFNFYAP